MGADLPTLAICPDNEQQDTVPADTAALSKEHVLVQHENAVDKVGPLVPVKQMSGEDSITAETTLDATGEITILSDALPTTEPSVAHPQLSSTQRRNKRRLPREHIDRIPWSLLDELDAEKVRLRGSNLQLHMHYAQAKFETRKAFEAAFSKA